MFSCSTKKQENIETQNPESTTVKNIVVPAFDENSAYDYIKKQLDFGPRVPNSKGHVACGDYMIAEFKKNGCEVTVQIFDQ